MSDAKLVPMNRAERRRSKQPKLTPANAIFSVRLLSRRERAGDDGTVYAQSYFQLFAPNGKPLCEEVGDGEVAPVILASVPQPIRRALIVTGSQVVSRR